MSWSASGLPLTTIIDVFDATQLAIDTSLTTHKIAVYNNTETPNFSTDSGYSATNEVSGTGYTAGGATLASPTTTESPTGTLKYDTTDPSWTSSTITNAYGAKAYADALAGNNIFCEINFGAGYNTSAGTLTLQLASGGMFTIDCTP